MHKQAILIMTVSGLIASCDHAAFATKSQTAQTAVSTPTNIDAKRLDELRVMCQKRLKQNPRDVEAMVQLGSTYQFLGEYDRAIDQFNNALAIDQKNWRAYMGRSLIFSKKGMNRESAQDLKLAFQYNPKLKQTLEATMAHAKSTVAKALAPYYVEGEQGYYTSKLDNANDRASSQMREGKTDLAIKTLTDGINNYPSSKIAYKSQEYAKYCLSKAYQLRSICYFKQKNLAKSIDDMTQAATLTPMKKEIYLDRSQLYAASGDKKKAMADAEKAKTLKPDWMPAGVAQALKSSMTESMSYAAKRGHDINQSKSPTNNKKDRPD